MPKYKCFVEGREDVVEADFALKAAEIFRESEAYISVWEDKPPPSALSPMKFFFKEEM